MPAKQSVQLSPVEETMLIPLFARAVESRRKHPILKDPRAAEIADTIDWDFTPFHQRIRVVACVMRTLMFDAWVRQFLAQHPAGTVVEIGAGFNTRFDRLDNQSVHWFDLELPAVAELRRKYFRDSARRTTLAASLLESDWMEAVHASPPPYFFVAETVLIYLPETDVKAALAQIARNFPGAGAALDTASQRAVTSGNKDFVRRKMASRFVWACDEPRTIETWNVGLRLVEARPFIDIPVPLRSRLSWPLRTFFLLFSKLSPNIGRTYQLTRFETLPHETSRNLAALVMRCEGNYTASNSPESGR